MEAENDELPEYNTELQARISDLERRNEELMVENSEIPHLRDTVEELRYSESKV